MGKYYSIKIFVDNYKENINQRKITKEIVDEICELLGVYYDKLGYIYLHPDYDFKNIGKMFIKSNNDDFFSLNIPCKMKGFKYPEEESAPVLRYEKKYESNESYSDFEISVTYPIKNVPLTWEIVIKEELLKEKNLNINIYKKILELILKNGFSINSSFAHYYSGSKNRNITNGFLTGIPTPEEYKLISKSNSYRFQWKNKIIDIFLYNTIPVGWLSNAEIDELQKIVSKENVLISNDYITFTYKTTKNKYLLEKIVPSNSKTQLRYLFLRLL